MTFNFDRINFDGKSFDHIVGCQTPTPTPKKKPPKKPPKAASVWSFWGRGRSQEKGAEPRERGGARVEEEKEKEKEEEEEEEAEEDGSVFTVKWER